MDNNSQNLRKFRDLSQEELEDLIDKRKLSSTSQPRKTSNQLAEGLNKFNDSHNTKWKQILLAICKTILFPWIIVDIIREIRKYKSYTELIKWTINSNQEFFDFLENFHFMPAWFTRLYSVQEIPEEFMTLDEKMLEGLTIQSLIPIRPMLAKSNLLSVLTLRVKRIDILRYIVILEPENFRNLQALIIWLASILVAIIVLGITLCIINI